MIAVSETWTGQSTENCIEIPGHNKVVKSRQAQRGGGLAIYTDSDLNPLLHDFFRNFSRNLASFKKDAMR